jgi:hypothetical protein
MGLPRGSVFFGTASVSACSAPGKKGVTSMVKSPPDRVLSDMPTIPASSSRMSV